MKLKESHRYSLTQLIVVIAMFCVVVIGWEIAKTFVWFADIWEVKSKRLLIVLSGVLCLISLGYFIYQYSWGKKKFIRTFTSVELKTLKDCRDDEIVRIQGLLVFIAPPLTAPFSKKPCSAYDTRALIQENVTDGVGRNEIIWDTIKHTRESQDFLIMCEEQYALIRVANSQIIIQQDIIHDVSDYDLDNGQFLTKGENLKRKEALEQLGIEPKIYIGIYAENIKFEEGILESGEQIAVKGKGKWITTAELPELSNIAEQGIQKVFEIKMSESDPVVISDSIDILDR